MKNKITILILLFFVAVGIGGCRSTDSCEFSPIASDLKVAYIENGNFVFSDSIPVSVQQIFVCGVVTTEYPIGLMIFAPKIEGVTYDKDDVLPGVFCKKLSFDSPNPGIGKYELEIIYVVCIVGRVEFELVN